MFFTKKRKRLLFGVGSILIFIVIINSVLSIVIKDKITNILLKSESKYYTANVGNVKFRLLRRSITLDSILLIPKQASLDSLEQNTIVKEALNTVSVASVKLGGIGIFSILFQSKIQVGLLEIKGLHIKKHIYPHKKNNKPKEKKALDLGAIKIAKLHGLQIDEIDIQDFIYEIKDVKSNELVFKNAPLSFKTTGFKLTEQKEFVFALEPLSEQIEIKDIKLNIDEDKIHFSIAKLAVDFKENLIEIQDLSYKPQLKSSVLAKSYPFSKSVMDLEVAAIKIHRFNLQKMLNLEGVFIDSIGVSGADLQLYKDKRLPIKKHKDRLLPNVALRQSKTPLYIGKITVKETAVLIEEQMAKRDTILRISLSNINVAINNISSLKEHEKESLTLDVKANLMEKAALKAHLSFPLKENANYFSYNGSLGAAKLGLFDAAIFPAIGLKVLEGNLDELRFSGTANNEKSSGQMTMKYHNLEAKVFKAHSLEKNKFLSWAVNAVLKKV